MTASRPLPLRRNAKRYDVTVWQPCQRDAATERCNTVSDGAVEAGNGVANETADSPGPAVLVGACRVFVALLHNHAKIVLADVDVNLRSPRRARCRYALIRSAAVAMVVSLYRGMVHAKAFPRRERPNGCRSGNDNPP